MAYRLTETGTLFDSSSFGDLCHHGSEGEDEWHGRGYTLACRCDVRAVFMRHHKYACGFVWCRGVHDCRLTVFELSEVIYLSSSLTGGRNATKDNCSSHPNRTDWEALTHF